MIKKQMQDAINKQIEREMYSSNLYLAMQSYFHSISLNGFANWMKVQAQEELFHAMRFFDYLIERGGRAYVSAIEAPASDWKSPLDAFEEVYIHEQKVTAWINELADLAVKESDHASQIFLQWFITEQVEEEANTSDIIERLKLVADSKGGIFMLDNELKTRVFVPPATNA